jgi:hypothetical protein
MADWATGRVGLSFVPPGQPWRNGYIESFNSRVRDECLNINSFWSPAHARVLITDWKDDYNHRRRHSPLGYQAPAHYAGGCTPPMNNSHPTWTTSRGPVIVHVSASDLVVPKLCLHGRSVPPRPRLSDHSSVRHCRRGLGGRKVRRLP